MMLKFRHKHPVFAIESNSKQMLRRIFALIEKLLANVINIGYEVWNGCFWRHGSILESNTVRDDSVSENHGNFATISSSDCPRCCKIRCRFHIDEISINICWLLQEFFIRHHPFNTNITDWFNHWRWDGLFAWPHTNGPESKFFLEEIHTCNQVVLNVIRPCFFVDSDAIFHCPAIHHQ